jgi:rhodanese-related sulfurtransferase
MSAVAASSVSFKTAVALRAVRARSPAVVRAAGRSSVIATTASVSKIPPAEVKDHLDRGFVLVDIRDPEECAETGYKSSWKNIVVRPEREFDAGARSERRPRAARVLLLLLAIRAEKKPTSPDRARTAPSPPFSSPSATWPGRRDGFYGFRAKTRVIKTLFFFHPLTLPLRVIVSQLAAMDEDGTIHMNPNFLAQIRQEFPNSMSRILIACDDGTFRSEKAAAAIVDKCGYTQVKVIDGGIDAYLAAFPLTDADKVKWRMRPEIGEDLSVLVSGVDTRQAGQKYY